MVTLDPVFTRDVSAVLTPLVSYAAIPADTNPERIPFTMPNEAHPIAEFFTDRAKSYVATGRYAEGISGRTGTAFGKTDGPYTWSSLEFRGRHAWAFQSFPNWPNPTMHATSSGGGSTNRTPLGELLTQDREDRVLAYTTKEYESGYADGVYEVNLAAIYERHALNAAAAGFGEWAYQAMREAVYVRGLGAGDRASILSRLKKEFGALPVAYAHHHSWRRKNDPTGAEVAEAVLGSTREGTNDRAKWDHIAASAVDFQRRWRAGEWFPGDGVNSVTNRAIQTTALRTLLGV